MVQRNIQYGILVIFLLINCHKVAAQYYMTTMYQTEGVAFSTRVTMMNSVGDFEVDGVKVENEQTLLGVHQTVNYLLTPHIGVGAALGFDKWNNTAFLPVSVNMNYYLNRLQYSPYATLDVGYAAKWYTDQSEVKKDYIHGNKEGLFFSGGAGLRIMLNSRIGVLVGVDVRLQQSEIGYSDDENPDPELTTNKGKKVNYVFWGVTAGLSY